jgi:hypothetical protein
VQVQGAHKHLLHLQHVRVVHGACVQHLTQQLLPLSLVQLLQAGARQLQQCAQPVGAAAAHLQRPAVLKHALLGQLPHKVVATMRSQLGRQDRLWQLGQVLQVIAGLPLPPLYLPLPLLLPPPLPLLPQQALLLTLLPLLLPFGCLLLCCCIRNGQR